MRMDVYTFALLQKHDWTDIDSTGEIWHKDRDYSVAQATFYSNIMSRWDKFTTFTRAKPLVKAIL